MQRHVSRWLCLYDDIAFGDVVGLVLRGCCAGLAGGVQVVLGAGFYPLPLSGTHCLAFVCTLFHLFVVNEDVA